MELPYNSGIEPLPNTIGYQIKISMPGIGYLFSSFWLVKSHKHLNIKRHYLATCQNLIITDFFLWLIFIDLQEDEFFRYSKY